MKDVPFTFNDIKEIDPSKYDIVTIRRCQKKNGKYITIRKSDPLYECAEFEEVLFTPKSGKNRVNELKAIASRIVQIEGLYEQDHN